MKLRPVSNYNELGNGQNLGLAPAERSSDEFVYMPYAVNAVEDGWVLLGGEFGLYVSTNYLTTVTRAQTKGGWTAVVFGGAMGNTPAGDVIYAARTGTDDPVINVEFPSPGQTPGSAISFEPLGAGTEVRDIVLDPRDYHVAYAATDVGIFRRNGSATAGGRGLWTLISQDLPNLNFQSLEYVEGVTPADDILLVGTADGIYRAFNPSQTPTDPAQTPPNLTWTLLGQNLPNSLVTDIAFVGDNSSQYKNANPLAKNLLVVGTQGRGAWTITAAENELLAKPILRINGTDENDTIMLSRNSVNPGLLDVTFNGTKIAFTTPLASIQQILRLGRRRRRHADRRRHDRLDRGSRRNRLHRWHRRELRPPRRREGCQLHEHDRRRSRDGDGDVPQRWPDRRRRSPPTSKHQC